MSLKDWMVNGHVLPVAARCDPQKIQDEGKKWRKGSFKLRLPVLCLTSWLTLEAGICGPHR